MPKHRTRIERIIALLESGEIKILFVPLYPGYDGWYFTKEKISIIRWHMSTDRTVDALIHACLHALSPGATHDWIWKQEKEVHEALTKEDRTKIETFLRRTK